jgi:N-carbamoylputrescine amidase
VRVTVCELSEEAERFAGEWEALVAHVGGAGSELVLLPEMPFSPWFAVRRPFDPAAWRRAVEAHEAWLPRLAELAPAAVLASRPVERDGRRLNEGFVWEREGGYRAAHHKAHLPEEEGFWEASWYEPGGGELEAVEVAGARVGFAICTELWAFEGARAYGRAGAHLLATPRATGRATVDKWLVGGRASAITAGAYSLSSNRASAAGSAADLGGRGWIVDPDGGVLGVTSREEPFLTREIDLGLAEAAKETYPRYVLL